ncbi:MAG TPA: translocation/assembly module TamB domain-containing protein, partial [Candidatus Deferrimicrobiaceae bacterium]
EDLHPVVQGHVELFGPPNDLLISGEVEVQSAQYTKTIRLEKAVLDFRRRQADVTARRKESDFRIRLDIDAVADETIRIQNNLGKLLAKGEFRIVGDTGRVIILGSFDGIEGTVEYRGNRFQVTQLNVDFQDPLRNNPRIEARAETRKGNVDVVVSVTGTLEKYEVEFASDPPLSKNDIISLLTLGVKSAELGGAEGSVSTAEAASIALGPYKGGVEEGIRGIAGLDRFTVEPSFSSTDKSFEPRVTVGKSFGERLSVSVSSSVGASAKSSAEAELQVLENVFLLGGWKSATEDSKGDIGGDVRIRYRFRQFQDIFHDRD